MAPYTGPIFDVQTHAVMPDAYGPVTKGIRASAGLTDSTKDVMINDICRLLADDLQSSKRKRALGQDTVHVVSVNTFFPPLPADDLIGICDRVNAWMAGATVDQPQLVGIATVPPPPLLARAGTALVERGLQSLRRAIRELGLRGVLFASNYDNVFLGHASFDPFFALVEELDVPIIIHPAVHAVEEQIIPWKNIGAMSGFLNDQRTTILDLVMAGVLEKYPTLTVVATHLGGGILTSLGRFRIVAALFPQELWYVDRDGRRRVLPQTIESYLKKIYYDCNHADLEDILHAAGKVGSDHLLTGTDFPWVDDRFARHVLGQIGDDATALELAYSNAARLFSRGGRTSPPLSNRPLL